MGSGMGGGEGMGGGGEEAPSGGMSESGGSDMATMMMADPEMREMLAKAMQGGGQQQMMPENVPSGTLAGPGKNTQFGPKIGALPVMFGGGG